MHLLKFQNMFEKSENISQHLPTSKKLKGIQKKYIHWCTPPSPHAKHGQAKLVKIKNVALL